MELKYVVSRSEDGKGASSSIRRTYILRPGGKGESLDARRACRS